MFSYLYDTLFPILGDIFGKLSLIASMPFEDTMHFLSYGGTLEFNNLFNDVITEFTINWLGLGGSIQHIVALISNTILLLIPNSLQVLPTWLCLLSCSFSLFLIFYVFKFIVNLFP